MSHLLLHMYTKFYLFIYHLPFFPTNRLAGPFNAWMNYLYGVYVWEILHVSERNKNMCGTIEGMDSITLDRVDSLTVV